MLVGVDAVYREGDSASGRFAPETPRFGVRRVYEDLYEALHNDSFRALFVGTLIYFIYAGTQGALWMHLMTFYWQLDTKAIEWNQYAGIIGANRGRAAGTLVQSYLRQEVDGHRRRRSRCSVRQRADHVESRRADAR